AASGSMSDTFRHRFSTKYYDTETGLYYYGYRFYNPVMHRWLNRDPIEEEGGLNFYLFCGNDGMNSMDFLGEFRALSGLYFETTHVIDPVSGRAKEEKIDPSQPYTGMFRHRVYEIIQLLSELSKQRDDKGNRLFTVTVKDFATADLTAMKEDVKSNRDHVYFIGHGGIVDKTSKSTIPVGVRYDWTRRNNRKTIEAFFPTGYTDRVITLDELGNPHDSNVFGCFISSRVRRQKGDLPFQPRWSTRDDYKMMFSALLGRLSRYKTSDARFESECPTRIIIYEGEIEGARESSTFIFDSLKLFD
ncbi:MAG: RHS repeat-associated core domain-containing protein, partial [Kiritimatiellia bacterium]